MGTIATFLVEVIITLLVCSLVTRSIRIPLYRILSRLCGTDEGAQFWTAFSSITLVGLPLIISLTYRPSAAGFEKVFFEVMGRLSANLAGYLATLSIAAVVISIVGVMVSFFGLVAPKLVPSEKQ